MQNGMIGEPLRVLTPGTELPRLIKRQPPFPVLQRVTVAVAAFQLALLIGCVEGWATGKHLVSARLCAVGSASDLSNAFMISLSRSVRVKWGFKSDSY